MQLHFFSAEGVDGCWEMKIKTDSSLWKVRHRVTRIFYSKISISTKFYLPLSCIIYSLIIFSKDLSLAFA